jgi:hypothetical protein
VSARYTATRSVRRLSAARKPRPSMDKLHTDLEALQAKLATMKRPAPGAGAATEAPALASAGRRPSTRGADRAAVPSPVGEAQEEPVPEGEQPGPVASAQPAAALLQVQTGDTELADEAEETDAALAAVRSGVRHADSALAAAAASAFEEAVFLQRCEAALTAQQGPARQLRGCLREALGKAAAVIDRGIELEAASARAVAAAQAATVRAEAARSKLEAEVAALRIKLQPAGRCSHGVEAPAHEGDAALQRQRAAYEECEAQLQVRWRAGPPAWLACRGVERER